MARRASSRELNNDLEMLHELIDDEERRFFITARRVVAPSQHGVTSSEWDLRDANATYTLQVGVYYNDANLQRRKAAAVAKCDALRAKGLEAYYYHADTCSMVTVGAFGPEAVLDNRGQVRFVGRGNRQTQVAHHYGPEVVSLQKRDVCKYNRTNDNIEYNIEANGKRVPVWSMLVHVPEDGDSHGRGRTRSGSG